MLPSPADPTRDTSTSSRHEFAARLMYCGTQAYALMSCEAEPEEAATRFALQLIMASASWHRLHGLASWHRLHGIGEEAATRLPTTDSLWTDDLSKDNYKTSIAAAPIGDIGAAANVIALASSSLLA